MEKLEIKYIINYLPYELACYASGEYVKDTEYDDNPIPKKFIISGIDTDSITGLYADGKEFYYDTIDIEDCFPLLRPLTDLNKIKLKFITGKYIDCEEHLTMVQYLNKYFDYCRIDLFIINNLSDGDNLNRVEDLSYKIFSLLCKYHFDVYNLIPNKLAIPIPDGN